MYVSTLAMVANDLSFDSKWKPVAEGGPQYLVVSALLTHVQKVDYSGKFSTNL